MGMLGSTEARLWISIVASACGLPVAVLAILALWLIRVHYADPVIAPPISIVLAATHPTELPHTRVEEAVATSPTAAQPVAGLPAADTMELLSTMPGPSVAPAVEEMATLAERAAIEPSGPVPNPAPLHPEVFAPRVVEQPNAEFDPAEIQPGTAAAEFVPMALAVPPPTPSDETTEPASEPIKGPVPLPRPKPHVAVTNIGRVVPFGRRSAR